MSPCRWRILLATSVLLAVPAIAQPADPDPRIRTLAYSPDRVFPLEATAGFALVVQVAEDERIDTIVVGNSGAWQVTANKRGNELVVKPTAGAAPTNMIVTTDARRYVFALRSTGGGDVPFVVKFSYPETARPVPRFGMTAGQYRLRGAKSLFPLSIVDDGRTTTIRWDVATPLPAILASDGRQEAILNGRMVDGDYVIEGVSGRYIFRRGRAEATADRYPVGGR